jgi:hypothetical protein
VQPRCVILKSLETSLRVLQVLQWPAPAEEARRIPAGDGLRVSCSTLFPIRPDWNRQRVEERVFEAAQTLMSLTDQERHRACSPGLMADTGIQGSGFQTSYPQPVDRVREALRWLGWLDPDLARLTWARAQGVSWKAVAHCFGVSVRTAQRRRSYALGVIVWRLHGRPIPRTWSRQFLLARVVALSRGL